MQITALSAVILRLWLVEAEEISPIRLTGQLETGDINMGALGLSPSPKASLTSLGPGLGGWKEIIVQCVAVFVAGCRGLWLPRLLALAISRFLQRLVRDGSYRLGLNIPFQDFDRAVTDALDYARGRRQGGGDREGHVPDRESQVCWSRFDGLVKSFFLGCRILSWRDVLGNNGY